MPVATEGVAAWGRVHRGHVRQGVHMPADRFRGPLAATQFAAIDAPLQCDPSPRVHAQDSRDQLHSIRRAQSQDSGAAPSHTTSFTFHCLALLRDVMPHEGVRLSMQLCYANYEDFGGWLYPNTLP